MHSQIVASGSTTSPNGRTHEGVLSWSKILDHLAVPLVLFGAVLTALLLLSWVLVLPVLTRVEIGTTVHDSAELISYYRQVRSELERATEQRLASVIPFHQTMYRDLVDTEHADRLAGEYIDVLYREMTNLVADQPDAVHMSSLLYDRKAHTLTVQGDVRNTGPRSMTVLARLTDTLDALEEFSVTERPRLERKDDPDIGLYSPFTLHLALQ